jgi:hypothetical protein
VEEEQFDDARRVAVQNLDHYMNCCFSKLPPPQIASAWQAIENLAHKRKEEAQKVATLP